MKNSIMKINKKNGMPLLLVPVLLSIGFLSVHADDPLQKVNKVIGMDIAIKAAQLYDPWLAGNKHSENAVMSMSVAAGSLPDPNISLGIANLAIDSFDFGQEAMTSTKIGISQMFPAGDSLAIRKKQLEIEGSQFPLQRQDRRARITVTVGGLWLDTYKAQESISLIEKNQALFEQLVDIAESSYSTALGKSRQQNVIRAHLELTRLEDRLTVLHQQREVFQQRLSEWLNDYFLDQYSDNHTVGYQQLAADFSLVRELPDIHLIHPDLYISTEQTSPDDLYQKLLHHPAMQMIEKKIRTSKAGIDLAKQKYKPAWGANAGYSYRSSDPRGVNRSDLLSVGVTFSVPLFTTNRQDRQVQAAMSKTSAVKTEKWQLLRKFTASFESFKVQLLRLNQRQELYQNQLLPQIHEQAEASLTAYTRDDGDFAEVVRARIAEMEAEIDALSINVDRQKTILDLNYLFITGTDEIITGDTLVGDMK